MANLLERLGKRIEQKFDNELREKTSLVVREVLATVQTVSPEAADLIAGEEIRIVITPSPIEIKVQLKRKGE